MVCFGEYTNTRQGEKNKKKKRKKIMQGINWKRTS